MELSKEKLKESIESLLKLQEIDGQVFQLKAEEKSTPSDVAELQTKLNEADRQFKAADRGFREADRERRSLELRSLTLAEDVKKSENKRTEVRNTKEEFAAGKEVDSFKKKLHELKVALDEKTTLTQQRSTAKDEKQKLLTEVQEQMKTLQEARQARVAAIRSDIEKLDKQRAEYISRVESEVFDLYERVQKIRRGNGIALVHDEICTGCNVTVPPHTRLQLYKMTQIITCSGCSRILFPADEVAGHTPDLPISA